MRSVLGSGVFNSDGQSRTFDRWVKMCLIRSHLGDTWKFHRAMARPFFTRDRITDFEIFARHADAVIAKIKSSLSSGHAVDFQVTGTPT